MTKNNNQLEFYGKEDINFPEFCFGIIGNIPPEKQPKELEFKDEKFKYEVKLTKSAEKCFPNQFTRDLHLTLVRLSWLKNGLSSDLLEISGREILKEMGMTACGENYRLLKNHLDILMDVRVTFQHCFFDKNNKTKITKTLKFSILQTSYLTELEDLKDGGNPRSLKGSIRWNTDYFNMSLNKAKNLIDFDFNVYSKLKGEITKNLYLLLNKRSHDKTEFSIDLKTLAFEKLGMNRDLEIFRVKENLKKSHQQLLDIGLLKELPIYTKEGGYHYVRYTFSKSKQLPEGIDPTVKSLLQLGFTRKQITILEQKYSLNEIVQALGLLEFSKSKVKNPKAFVQDVLNNPNKYDFDKVEKPLTKEDLFEEVPMEDDKQTEKLIRWKETHKKEYKAFCEEFIKVEETKNSVIWKNIKGKFQKGMTQEEVVATPAIAGAIQAKLREKLF